MIISVLPVGHMEVNCYVISDPNGKAVVIDPGSSAELISGHLLKNNLHLEAILLTHGHFDHFMAAGELMQTHNVKLYLHQNDYDKLWDDKKNLSYVFDMPDWVHPVKEQVEVLGDDNISVGEIAFSILGTPGHSSGSVCYRVGSNVFSGDTLFYGSVGRTDLYDGNQTLLVGSLIKLDDWLDNGDSSADKIIIYPGHGNKTTLAFEREHNIYLAGMEQI